MSNANWSDLSVRVISALVMLAIFVAAVFAGPTALTWLIILCILPMAWEIGNLAGAKSLGLAAIVALMAAAMAVLLFAEPTWRWLALPVVGIAVFLLAPSEKLGLGLYAAAVLLAVYFLIWLAGGALPKVLILIGIVVLSDVAGYFAGKSLGGPKFWPAISPKKTWSGTAAGWLAAAAFAAVLFVLGHQPAIAMVFFVVLAFGAQMGDIAESALKRRTGVKDSSNLIPGHGGFLDRFDGIIGAVLVLGVLGWTGLFAL